MSGIPPNPGTRSTACEVVGNNYSPACRFGSGVSLALAALQITSPGNLGTCAIVIVSSNLEPHRETSAGLGNNYLPSMPAGLRPPFDRTRCAVRLKDGPLKLTRKVLQCAPVTRTFHASVRSAASLWLGRSSVQPGRFAPFQSKTSFGAPASLVSSRTFGLLTVSQVALRPLVPSVNSAIGTTPEV
jgi:hypothetical protein